MTRPSIGVRDACPDDLPALLAMSQELRDEGGRLEKMLPPVDEDAILDLLRSIECDSSARVLVAEVETNSLDTDGQHLTAAGMVMLTTSRFAPLFDQTVLHVHHLHVRDGLRRRGVGQALLSAATGIADEVGAEQIVTSVSPQLRETQRFFAQLGFGPVAVRRAVPVTALRRRLSQQRQTPLDQVLAKRRTLRRLHAAVARVTD